MANHSSGHTVRQGGILLLLSIIPFSFSIALFAKALLGSMHFSKDSNTFAAVVFISLVFFSLSIVIAVIAFTLLRESRISPLNDSMDPQLPHLRSER